MAEILAPAGNEECAYAALNAGANAIYLGLSKFSARSSAENFTVEALCRICTYAHLLSAKIYVCLNTLVKDDETDEFFRSALSAYNAGADAILVQDLFLGKVLKETYPEMTLHLSTQGGCCNEYGALLAKECGFSRVVLARETPLSEIGKISEIIETEAFVQGALCSSFSGQCYFSSFAGNNSGNRGRCKQPCRKRYSIDRSGFEEPAYALSLSDLSVGEKIEDYLSAGVTSLKIEGRMRRPEYAAAAVKYYAAILEKRNPQKELSVLKRTYNRGNYTKGLAFGQDKSFLSRSVQGHVGEEVGEIISRDGFCKSNYRAEKGDGFKILRGGKEVGGAAFVKSAQGGFYLSSSTRLSAGDRVFVTTSGEALRSALADKKERRVNLKLRFLAGEKPRAEGEGFCLEGENISEAAKNAPLKSEDLTACFSKTDSLPFAPEITVETDGVFLPKSELNAFRRAFFKGLANHLAPVREQLIEREIPAVRIECAKGNKTAAIVSDGEAEADILIHKPCDYAHMPARAKKKESYLYLPPFFTSEDEAVIAPYLDAFDGIYCDGYYGILLAKKYHKKLFAGTGFNLTNRYAVSGVSALSEYFALSKEISLSEERKLSAPNAFSLAGGGVKLMDLIYCPFSRSCASCDQRREYTLTDEEGRKFPLRRYRLSGEGCRFEVYNCACLSSEADGFNKLFDGSVDTKRIEKKTKGHFFGSVL